MIKNGKVVNLAYVLKDDSGEVLDEAESDDPFVYLHGVGQIVPGLESALEGLDKGDKKNVSIDPEQGYGDVNENLRVQLEKDRFPKGAKLVEGAQFATQTDDGHELVFRVEKIQGDVVHLDGNHPLAGVKLHFDVEVLSVRDATEEELQHGHAHGEHGHH